MPREAPTTCAPVDRRRDHRRHKPPCKSRPGYAPRPCAVWDHRRPSHARTPAPLAGSRPCAVHVADARPRPAGGEGNAVPERSGDPPPFFVPRSAHRPRGWVLVFPSTRPPRHGGGLGPEGGVPPLRPRARSPAAWTAEGNPPKPHTRPGHARSISRILNAAPTRCTECRYRPAADFITIQRSHPAVSPLGRPTPTRCRGCHYRPDAPDDRPGATPRGNDAHQRASRYNDSGSERPDGPQSDGTRRHRLASSDSRPSGRIEAGWTRLVAPERLPLRLVDPLPAPSGVSGGKRGAA